MTCSRKWRYLIALLLCLPCSLVAVSIWWQRRNLPYNDLGQYFDGYVVIHQQAVFIYGAIALLSGLLAVYFAVRLVINR
ncbi:MAG: hypothetical protein ACPG4U_11015 [Pseudomonadales bacterium]